MKNNFKGGMSSDLTAFDVAKKWKISPIEFMPILEKGTEHEMEHIDTIRDFKKKGVSDREVAEAIAKDHLEEDENYYIELDKMESSRKLSEAIKEFDNKELSKKIEENLKKQTKVKSTQVAGIDEPTYLTVVLYFYPSEANSKSFISLLDL